MNKKFYSEYKTKTADELEAVLKEMHLIRYLARFQRGHLIKMMEEAQKKLKEAQKKLEELDTTQTFWQVQRDTLKAQIKAYEFELKFVELEQILETKI